MFLRHGLCAILVAALAPVVLPPCSIQAHAAATPAVQAQSGLNADPNRIQHPRGFVQRTGHSQKTPAAGAAGANPDCSSCNPPLLFTQGAPVMGGLSGTPGHVTIYPVYWAPSGYSFNASYKSVINGYVQNVALASGQTMNVFSVATEYYQQASAAGSPLQHIQYAITAGAEIDDANPFPAQNSSPGCIASAGFSACVSDGGLQTELRNKVNSLGLPVDDSHLYLVMFPAGVQTCEGTGAASSTNGCSSNSYCAYHSGTSTPNLIYSNQPYPDLMHCADPWNGAQQPNGDAEADAQISLISHEANESITDWAGAWQDAAGYEDGDECAYVFGAPLGSTGGAGTYYNQVIGGGKYYTQEEFSNSLYAQGKGDVNHVGGTFVPGCTQRVVAGGPTVTAVSPGSGSTTGGASITISGVGFTGANAVSFGGTPAANLSVLSDSQMIATAPNHAAGAVDVTVTTGAGTSTTNAADLFTYVSVPQTSACSTSQYSLTGSNGSTWAQIDGSKLSLSFTPTADSYALLGGNADLWTSSAGFNQDLGIAVSGPAFPTAAGQPEGWKESGGFAGTFSPNAALVQTVIPVLNSQTYTATLVWKANKPDPGTIWAGAGPVGGKYSNTCVSVRLVPTSQGSLIAKSSTGQYHLANSDGATWQDIDAMDLSLTFAAPSSGTILVGGNADLWTANAGYSQDIGITVSGGTYPSVSGQPEAWKESGGFAGTFSPNAAFVQAAMPVSGGGSYTVKLQWKTNTPASGAIIYAGAGPIGGRYSPTTLSLLFLPSAGAPIDDASTSQYWLSNSDGSTWLAMDAAKLTIAYTPANNCQVVVGANADLWTANAGFNQDIAISFASGGAAASPAVADAWKESGGFSGTYSPNAADVQVTETLLAGHTYTFQLIWKTNKPAGGATIYAGAGPIIGKFSPTRLTLQPIGC